MTNEELEQIRRRCDAATPGPWKAFIEGRDHDSGSNFIMTGVPRSDGIELFGATTADYDFVAQARQDIPKLLAEVERLRGMLGR